MIKKTITYKDYNGEERTETFHFNLNKAEVMELQMGTTGGFSEYLQRIIDAKDHATIVKVFKEMILKAYGEKSPDGRRFIKSEELSTAFSQTEAYAILYMELSTNVPAATEFVKGIIPSDLDKIVDGAAIKTTV
ncbi:MAG: hypothetical protein J6Q84_07335 [Kiritimatiellae bacterium]|nr:hypothetical protein [Kiritimatiellia bacterium]